MLKVARRRACPLVESGYWDRENVVTRPGPEADHLDVCLSAGLCNSVYRWDLRISDHNVVRASECSSEH